MGAGHPRMSFELDTFTTVEPAHFKIDADWEKRKQMWDGVKDVFSGAFKALWGLMRSQIKVFANVAAAIGNGIKPQSLHPDQTTKEKIQKLWRKTWGFYLDAIATSGLRPGETPEQREKVAQKIQERAGQF